MSNRNFYDYESDDLYVTSEQAPKRARRDVSASSNADDISISSYSKAKREKSKNIKKKRKGMLIRNAVISILLVICLLVVGTGGVLMYTFKGFTNVEINEENLGITNQTLNTKVKNIALFGVDTRDFDKTKGRSDTIIVLSVDPEDNALKFTSILRDSYVEIEGHNPQKITHAYMLGGWDDPDNKAAGAELAIKTINQNFDLNVSDYVTVNFGQLSHVIDLVGGLDLYVTYAEMNEMNRLIRKEGFGIKEVTQYSQNEKDLIHLDGAQSMMFARIRKIDSDGARSERQFIVMSEMLNKVLEMNVLSYPSLLKEMLKYCETSLSFNEIMQYLPMVTDEEKIKYERISVPGEEDNAKGGIYGSAGWVWLYDTDAAAKRIHKFIYDTPINKVKKAKAEEKKKAKEAANSSLVSSAE